MSVQYCSLASCSPQLVILLVDEFEGDLSRLALNHHTENVLILESSTATGATSELDHALIGSESRLAWRGGLFRSLFQNATNQQPFFSPKDISTLYLRGFGAESCMPQSNPHVVDAPAIRAETVFASWLVLAADRRGDGSPSRDGWRLLAVGRDSLTQAGRLGTRFSGKTGHRSDHRLFVGKNGFGAD
jgi:hypothetical protein